jgi:hypothetical protein
MCPDTRSRRRLAVLILCFLVIGAAICVHLCVASSRNLHEDAIFCGQEQWLSELDRLRPIITRGPATEAETAWDELHKRLNRRDPSEMRAWIDLQVEIIDIVQPRDSSSRVTRLLAMQQLEQLSALATGHYDWLRGKLERGEFDGEVYMGKEMLANKARIALDSMEQVLSGSRDAEWVVPLSDRAKPLR